MDIHARDSHDRLSAHEHQQELLGQLCKVVSERTDEDIDRRDLLGQAVRQAKLALDRR